MQNPSAHGKFIYKGKKIGLEYFDIKDKESIPDVPFNHIYAVGDLDGLVPLVNYADGHQNLPGGHIEVGEDFEQALRRELEEGLNCELLEW